MLVRPLEIVEHEQERGSRGEPGEQRRERRVQARAGGIGREVRRCGVALEARERREARLEVHEQACVRAQDRVEAGRVSARVERREQEPAQRMEGRSHQARDRVALGPDAHALARHDHEAATRGERRRLHREARLADAALAADHDERAARARGGNRRGHVERDVREGRLRLDDAGGDRRRLEVNRR